MVAGPRNHSKQTGRPLIEGGLFAVRLPRGNDNLPLDNVLSGISKECAGIFSPISCRLWVVYRKFSKKVFNQSGHGMLVMFNVTNSSEREHAMTEQEVKTDFIPGSGLRYCIIDRLGPLSQWGV